MINKFLLPALLLLFVNATYSQSNLEFESRNDYLVKMERTFSLDTSNLYYISNEVKDNIVSYPSLVFFVIENRLFTLEEVMAKMDINCSANTFVKKLNKFSFDGLVTETKPLKSTFVIKSMLDEKKIKLNDSPTVLVLFSKNLTKKQLQYLEYIGEFEKMGFSTYILTFDAHLVSGLDDYSKDNMLYFKSKS